MKTCNVNPRAELAQLFESIGETVAVLRKGGLVCVPCAGSYRLMTDLTSVEAVNHLLQAKGRTQKSPALVLIADEAMLKTVAAQVPPVAQRLMKAFWPGNLTILFEPHPDLPSAVVKQLSKAHGKLGVRIPAGPLVREIVHQFGRPVLVSSANKQQKQGASSPAQVRKNFASRLDLFLDGGDLPSGQASTVVEIDDLGQVLVTRPGQLSLEQITTEV